MIRIRAVTGIVAQFLGLLSASMLVPLIFAITGEHDDARPMLYAVLITSAAAMALAATSGRQRKHAELGHREALLVVVLIWVLAGFFGSLPFQFSPHFPSFTDALFESVSGFTTTGASILSEVEALTPSVQLWRHLTHWLGGIGVVMLMIAVLPIIGYGTAQLYRAQFAGGASEKLKPRFVETARALWKIYVGLTLAEYIALRIAGMGPFDAVCHAFSTIATGGFSTRNTSVAAFSNPAIEYIIVLFMLLASMNFARHYRLWVERRPLDFIRDLEVRWHIIIISTATLVVTAGLLNRAEYSFEVALRRALFQVTSIGTCTGFATDDYEKWGPLAHLLLLALMYTGGNTGSTAGGLKTFRIILMVRVIKRHLNRVIHRRGVFALRVGSEVLPEETARNALSMVTLALIFNFGVDIVTSISSVASAMFGVGPALGTVGPAENYGHLPLLAKWCLMGSMIAGRLEFYTALVVFTPWFWHK
jgi:trk system potassium uptake protein TrkH